MNCGTHLSPLPGDYHNRLAGKLPVRGWRGCAARPAVMVAPALWYPAIDFDIGCGSDISSSYVCEVTNIMVVLLLTLGIEMIFIRR